MIMADAVVRKLTTRCQHRTGGEGCIQTHVLPIHPIITTNIKYLNNKKIRQLKLFIKRMFFKKKYKI